jgi:flagellar FliL protein
LAGPSASSSNAPSSSVQTVTALVVATVIGVGGGGFVGYSLIGETPSSSSHGGETKEPPPAAPKSGGDAASSGQGHGASNHAASGHGASGHAEPAKEAPAPVQTKLKELAPIVTNLAAPETSWVRLQAALVYDGEAAALPDILVSEVTADIVAFLRTMSLESIEGADGLRRLHEDLSERAMIRSEGKIRELIIQALVVQ